MPDKFYADGTVDLKITVFLSGVPVEGYGQTESEAEDDALEDVLDTSNNDPGGIISSFSRFINHSKTDAFVLSQKVKVKEIDTEGEFREAEY